MAETDGIFQRFARYQPLALLGQGASGVVHRVRDTITGGEVALKTLPADDPELLYSLKQEFRALAGIRHRNLVELYELTAAGGVCFFTMELVDGCDLLAYVREGLGAGAPPTPRERLLHAASQLTHGLAALHAAGKLHRDVKPSNALVDRHGRVVLLDFGLAAAHGPGEGSARRELAGTVAYMAPEVLRGQPASPASDWYGMGVVLFEALAGRLPFEGPAARQFVDKTRAEAPRLRQFAADAGDELDELVARLLERDPAARPSASEIEAALERCRGVAAAATTASTAAEPLPFVGREAELELLRTAYRSPAPGRATVAHLHGPSGIGKSEIVRHFLRELGSEAVVLRGRCHPYETVPYNAFDGLIDSLSRHLRELEDEERVALLPAHGAALVQLFPVLARIPELAAGAEAAAEPAELRRRGFAALCALLAAVGRRAPLVLWIDDYQWRDEDSAALLRELLLPQDSPGFLLLLSYRDEACERVRAELERDAAAGAAPASSREIAVAPLGAADTQALTSRLAGGVDVAAVLAQAQGSPFFLTQLVRHLASPTARAASPVDLASLIDARVAELNDLERDVLEVVSIAGQPIDRRLALAATGAGERARTAVIGLEQEQLLRSTQLGEETSVEVYHDRIREMLLPHLPEERVRRRHRQLAEVLVRQPEPDAHALFRHWLGAGESGEAGNWAVEAAERADRTLAFAEAAQFYGRALELLDATPEVRHRLGLARAEALVNAGHGGDAAPLFLAEAVSPGADRLELRRRAAEQFLVTGRIEEGTEVVRALLSELALPYPRSPLALGASLVARLLRVLARAGRWRRATPTSEAAVRLRADTCHAVAKGLVLVDPPRGLYYSLLALDLALRAGAPERIGRSFATLGAALVPMGGPLARWASQRLEDAQAIAAETGDPYLRGFARITMAQKRMMEADWRAMLALCDEGVATLSDHCRGVGWEIEIGRMAATRALEELGELPEMERRTDRQLRQAEERSDVYAIVTALMNKAACRLAADDLGAGRALMTRARSLWTQSGVHMQHFYALRFECHCELAEHRPLAAWSALETQWKELERSGMLRHALLRLDAHLLRARVAVAAAGASGESAGFLAQAEKEAVVLAREGRADAAAHGEAIRAAIAWRRKRGEEAEQRLRAAAQGYGVLGMALDRAAMQARLASLSPAEKAQRSEADTVFARAAIGCPERWLAVRAPGFE